VTEILRFAQNDTVGSLFFYEPSVVIEGALLVFLKRSVRQPSGSVDIRLAWLAAIVMNGVSYGLVPLILLILWGLIQWVLRR